ncbi:site-specific DNA-methyltransferase [Glutamicibacter arilaitensis]|uniref:site-specific DNA-methyltransferase n=1 Tax=Glutamicibacter arilaitensis TaxID=256701 RepID=UPI003FD1565E
MGAQKQRLELTWYNKNRALIPTSQGKYGYTWVDPQDPRYCETHTLKLGDYITGIQHPRSPEITYGDLAGLPPTHDNLLVLGESGDVLEALTRVPELAEKYVNQVKCIYIDPPFNTKQTFEHYEDNLEHSIWLTMMRDRLQHMRRLLSKDGSIWVHLDDAESHRMRVLLDEVFGAHNYVAEIAWQKTYAPENRSVFTQSHDMVFLYAKNWDEFKKSRNLLPRSAAQDIAYQNPDNDPRGPWKPGDFTAQYNPKENERKSQIYTLTTPAGNSFTPPSGRCWLLTEPRYQELLADNRISFGANGNGRPALKRFRSEVMQGRVPDSWWSYQDVGHSQDAKKEILNLFPGQEPFATPKPEKFLERVIQISTNPGDLVLDTFGGSGTTAAVAHKMGRRWITCELLDDTFNRYTLPRLTKVVQGVDLGGITSTSGERVDATVEGLPEAMTAEEAQKLTSLLNKAIKDQPELKKSIDIKTLKSLIKTKRSPDVMNWRGGGGFQVAHLSPACFDYSPELGLTTLTKAASDLEVLTSSVAAQLGFHLTPMHELFHGLKGAMRLYVTRTPLTPELVTEIAGQLNEGERVTIASTVVLDKSRQALRETSKGSRIIHIPNDLFRFDEEVSN